ncbi:hypothetical protein HNY73_015629 [Argiope bruennichi]|uniref:Uncharacterized protein n=1 Tax=Argiope bruennichi TaxID=94029 RepID=A0A8T0EXF7_ARGBR|nr:hypothetical protein HNY73_015629 [Argiope bruennichi]
MTTSDKGIPIHLKLTGLGNIPARPFSSSPSIKSFLFHAKKHKISPTPAETIHQVLIFRRVFPSLSLLLEKETILPLEEMELICTRRHRLSTPPRDPSSKVFSALPPRPSREPLDVELQRRDLNFKGCDRWGYWSEVGRRVKSL